LRKLRVLDLFSGIGGFSLGLERAGMETVAFCEIDEFCQKVLKKNWPDVPIFNDVRSLDYDGSIDVICGGYPCQPFSLAGNRKGAEDDRHLWSAMFGLIQKHRPRWVIGENVAGHISMGIDSVLTDLESEFYTTRAFIIPACAVNAPHRRDRVWIVANAKSKQGTSTNNKREQGTACQSEQSESRGRNSRILRGCDWEFEPAVGRVVNGVPDGMDRLKSLGNAVVPQIPEIIGRAILNIEYEYENSNW